MVRINRLHHSNPVIVLTLTILVVACSGREGLSVQDAWARPAQAGDNGAVYFTIQNSAKQEDSLTSSRTDVAAQSEIHQSSMDSAGTMTMRHQPSVSVPAGDSVTFKPGGYHLMLIGLQRDLVPGDRFMLQLSFENAGEISVEVDVREP